MADDHESAVAAWLDSPETKRELSILYDRFPTWSDFQRIQIALSMEILVSLNLYTDERDADVDITIIKPDDDDPPEPWKDPDASGWKP